MPAVRRRTMAALLCCGAVPLFAGCSESNYRSRTVAATGLHDECGKAACKEDDRCEEPRKVARHTLDETPQAEPGECFARVYIPPKTETVTETVCVKEASEQIEIVPARYEWVEEEVCVKPATKRLEEVAAQYKWIEKQVKVQDGSRGWVVKDDEACTTVDGQELDAPAVFCFVENPPVYETVRVQVLDKPACVREVTEPAQYETVRVQKMVEPATTRKTTIPAEFEQVQKTIVVHGGRIEWQRAVCNLELPDQANAAKRALQAAGYPAGQLNGQLDKPFWTALERYQMENGLGVGALTHETLDHLNLAMR